MSEKKYFVKLEALPNSDYDLTNYRATVYIPARKEEVGSLKDAAAKCRWFIEYYELGGGNWTGGEVTNEAGEIIARISYNGRIWDPRPWPECKEITEEEVKQ
jgi:hypothetical protein